VNGAKAFAAAATAGVFALGAAGILAAALRSKAAAHSHELPPYFAPPAVMAETLADRQAHGRKLYFKSCAHCHGIDATGDEGPDLHELEVSDRRIATVIKRGIKGEMPSFAKKHDDTQIAELVAYVRSLQE
jgi:mono/diheme cytochrome c family protein